MSKLEVIKEAIINQLEQQSIHDQLDDEDKKVLDIIKDCTTMQALKKHFVNINYENDDRYETCEDLIMNFLLVD